MRLVFLGSGRFAVPALEALAASGHEIAAVVTQPDRQRGRGLGLAAPPVKPVAHAMGLPVLQPQRVKDPQTIDSLAALAPEIQIVVAYGQILPRAVFEIAPLGTINLHASLLPLYRGAAPIQWAIARGEETTGVTTMLIDEGLDTGPLLLSSATPIGPEETAGELEARLAQLGAPLIVETVKGLGESRLVPRPQDHQRATLAPLIRKADGRIDWQKPAQTIARQVRAFNPWPGARTQMGGRFVSIIRARAVDPASGEPGRILAGGKGTLRVVCGETTCLEILELQPENRRRMPAADFLRGLRLTPETRFT